jgi:cell shape-determining protein MreD
MTAMPEGILMVSCLGVALTAQVFKKRIYWNSASYVMMVSGLGALLFQIIHWGATHILGDGLTSPAVIDWLIEALLTPLVAPVLFPVFRWFDRVTDREPAPEMTARMT